MSEYKRITLAYSGGLDTSVIAKWLQVQYNCEVVTFTADIGLGEDLQPAQRKAEKLGIKQIFIEDLRDEFVRDYVFPMLRANSIYEGEYLLGTSIARPLIAKRLVEIARQTGSDAIAHGATGKGNDQVRFELNAYALDPKIKVVAPWRIWQLNSRQKLLSFCQQHGIEVDMLKEQNKPPYSIDANLLHISYEGGNLEDPDAEPDPDMWQRTRSLAAAEAEPEVITIKFTTGDACAINGSTMSAGELLTRLNEIGGRHGIGRVDLVENRFVGMKSRGCYETPGGSILLKAHRALESICLSRDLAHLKDDLMPRYAEMIYNGYWFSPQRVALQQLIDYSQRYVNGEVRLQLHKGNIIVLGRSSPHSLFDASIATFEDDAGSYNQQDASGFIRLKALPLQISARARQAL